ncbi:hypothetical protein MACJ_000934 [Theileria orientalis]|uniref:Uncharacterized protein n=1 Tax=Theileria orientalis TaxID=68886 RepID=A0A976M4Z3_THEOR|nr:hypothetical protein MACJ_000934 [Theileria orientalis]
MAVPKLPLIVPKKAPSILVPKVAPKLAPVLLPKNPPLTKSLHSVSTSSVTRPVGDNSGQKAQDKLTKLVSQGNLSVNKLNSNEEYHNEPGYAQGNSNSEAQVAPPKAFSQNSKNFEPSTTLLNGRKPSNGSFHDDLAARLNASSILNDLGAPQYKKLTTKPTSNDGNPKSQPPSKSVTMETDKLSKAASNVSDASHNGDDVSGPKNESFKFDGDEREDVGYTPWLKIERRINQIRSMASKDSKSRAPANKPSQGPNLYSNYNPEYVEGKWKKEVAHPLSYGMVQKLNDRHQFDLPKDNWKFINGFLRPRRKPFTSMSEMSKHFQKVDAKDQYELIKLLLACRDLEKLIEEQHTVLDMLDHDLREARDLFPDSLNNVTTQKLHGSVPEDEPFYPSSEAPLFIKGRVFLLPNKGKGNNGGGKK